MGSKSNVVPLRGRRPQEDERIARAETELKSRPSHAGRERLLDLLVVRAERLYREGDVHAAITDLDRLVQLVPNDALVAAQRALALLELGEADHAYVEASRAIELDPRLVPAWQARACACETLGLADQAASDYDAAIALAPDHLEIRIARSRHTIRTDPGRALVDLEHARRVAPDDARVLDGCAYAYYELGRGADGDQCMEHLLAKHPTAVGSACAFAHRLSARGDRERAEKVVRDAMTAAPDSPDIGMALVIIGRLELERWQGGDARGLPAAIEAFDRAADELGEPEAFAGRALVRELLGPGDYEESLRDLGDAIAFEAEEPSFWVQRARLHEKHGHARRAMSDWRHAATLGSAEARAELRRRARQTAKTKAKPKPPRPSAKTKKR